MPLHRFASQNGSPVSSVSFRATSSGFNGPDGAGSGIGVLRKSSRSRMAGVLSSVMTWLFGSSPLGTVVQKSYVTGVTRPPIDGRIDDAQQFLPLTRRFFPARPGRGIAAMATVVRIALEWVRPKPPNHPDRLIPEPSATRRCPVVPAKEETAPPAGSTPPATDSARPKDRSNCGADRSQ